MYNLSIKCIYSRKETLKLVQTIFLLYNVIHIMNNPKVKKPYKMRWNIKNISWLLLLGFFDTLWKCFKGFKRTHRKAEETKKQIYRLDVIEAHPYQSNCFKLSFSDLNIKCYNLCILFYYIYISRFRNIIES